MKKFNGSSYLSEIFSIYMEEVHSLEEEYCKELIEKNGSCWGNVGASEKYAVRQMLQHTDLPYTKTLGTVLRVFLFGEYNRKDIILNHAYDLRLDEAMYNLVTTGYIVP